MSRIGYFRYLREYAKLNREEPRIGSAGEMWRLMAVPLIAGAALYVPCAMLFSHFTKCPLPDPIHFAFKTAWQTLLVILVIPFLGLHLLIAVQVKSEIAASQNKSLKSLRREMIYSHLPWFATWYIFWIPVSILCDGLCCCKACNTYLYHSFMLHIAIWPAVLPSFITTYTCRKKLRKQFKTEVKLPVKESPPFSRPWDTKTSMFKILGGLFFFLAVFVLLSPVFISLSPSSDKEPMSFSSFVGATIVFALFSVVFAIFGIISWKRGDHAKNIFQKIASLSGEELKQKLNGLSDYDLCMLFETLLSGDKSFLLESVTTDMITRGLIGDEVINSRRDLYLFNERDELGGHDIHVSNHYILMEPQHPLRTDNLVIHNDRLDSAIISEKHAIVTVTVLEIKFHRKTYRDKFVVHTDHLDQWLALFEKLGVPVEDRRKPAGG